MAITREGVAKGLAGIVAISPLPLVSDAAAGLIGYHALSNDGENKPMGAVGALSAVMLKAAVYSGWDFYAEWYNRLGRATVEYGAGAYDFVSDLLHRI